MGYPKTRAKYGYGPDVPDEQVVLQTRKRPEFSHVTNEDFAHGIDTYEGGAPAGSASPAPKPQADPTTMPGVYGKVIDVAKGALGMGANFVKDTAKSMADIPQGLVVDPLKQVFQNRAATPEEEKRSFSGLAGLTGLLTAPGITEAAGMGAARLGGPKILQKLLAGSASGALLGGGDAAIRSGGKASAIPGGMAGGGLVGGFLGGLLPGHKAPVVGDTAAEVRPAPEWSSGLEHEGQSPYTVGGKGKLKPAQANALEGLYGGAQDEAPVPQPKSRMSEHGPAPSDNISDEQLATMDQGQLEALHTAQKAWEKGVDSQVLGPDLDAYNKAQRIVNSSNADYSSPRYKEATDLIQRIEAGLHPEDEKALFGIGQKYQSAEDLRDVLRHSDKTALIGEHTDDEVRYKLARALADYSGIDTAGGKLNMTRLLGEMQRRGLSLDYLNETNPSPFRSHDELEIAQGVLRKMKEMGQRKVSPELPEPPPSLAVRPEPNVPMPSESRLVNAPKAKQLEGLYGKGRPPKKPGSFLADAVNNKPPDLPMNPKSQLARSPVGPLVSSVTDRMRAMGPTGKAIDDMIENVARQSQEEPGTHLQPFDEAVHTVAGKKGRLAVDQRSQILGALERGADPKTLPPGLLPLYEQQKAYYDATIQRGTKLGSTVGKEKIPIAKAAIKNFFPHQVPTVEAITKDADLRSQMERNLMDKGLAKSPQEAKAILDDHIAMVESDGRTGGQLAIRATQAMNPDRTPQELKYHLLNPKPAIRETGSSLEHARTVNTPFYDPRPEVVFPHHVVENERALAEIQHYGQDASKLTGEIQNLPPSMRREAEHLVRTATESQPEGDPRLAKGLAKIRSAQLGLFTPQTAVKNVSQRANNLLTSDVGPFLRRGIIATKGAAKIGARSGARAEGAHETLAQALGTSGKGFGPRWLKMIGFTQAERGNRNTGAATGLDEAGGYAARLGKNPNNRLANYRLSREGINPGEVQGGALNPQQENRAGLQRSNTAQFRSHPKDLADWMTSTPVGRTLGLFKGFDYQQTRLMLDETLGRLASGQPGDKARALRNMGIIGTVYPVIGEGVNDIYGIISRKESPKHVVQRTKEFIHDTAQVASGKMNVVDYAEKYKARYGADLLAGSAPGAGGVLATAFQYGKGDKGGGLVKQAVGPAISRPAEAAQLSYDALNQKDKQGKDKPMTPAQKREALRLLLGGPGSMAGPWIYPDKH